MECIANITIVKVGDSKHLLLPSQVAKVLKWEVGTRLTVSKDGNKLVFEKAEVTDQV